MADRMHILALDLGTTSLKAEAFDTRGRRLASASDTYPTTRPAAKAAEQDPDDWWRATRNVVASLLANPALARSKLVAIGLSGQMHGVVLRDAGGRLVRPCLTWADERGGERLGWLAGRVDPARTLAITGNPLNAGFSAAKLDWVRANEPEAWRSVATILFPKDELRRRLTGEIATDATDASGSLLLDLAHRTWSAELADAWEVDLAFLPPIRPSAGVAGRLTAAAAAELGLAAGVLVMTGAGDTPAAALGLGIESGSGGVGMLGIGTAAQLLVGSTAPPIDPLGRLNALCDARPDGWCALAAVLDGGGALEWVRSIVGGGGESISTLIAEAEIVPAGADGLTFLPHLSGERTPGMDAAATASFIGLTTRHGRAHLVRAVLEGVAYSIREGLDILSEIGMRPTGLRAGGTPVGSLAWVRILTEVLGLEIHLSGVEQASARGAALIAATSFDPSSASSWEQTLAGPSRRVEPRAAEQARYDDGYALYRRLRTAGRHGVTAPSARPGRGGA